MPRIDPLQLLTCLSGLLAPNGGIRGANDVKRLTVLMSKFSKKLVSKCIYIQILKCTETDLLGQFMSVGGWVLVHVWLTDGIQSKNWPLVKEILELLLLCPVDVQRLKSNTAPKLVKQLSKDGGIEAVRILAAKLVEQWLKIVRSETVDVTNDAPNMACNNQFVEGVGASLEHQQQGFVAVENPIHSIPQFSAIPDSTTELPLSSMSPDSSMVFVDSLAADEVDSLIEEAAADLDPLHMDAIMSERTASDSESTKPKGLVYKITMKDGQQVLAKVDNTMHQSPLATVGQKVVVKRKNSDADPAVVSTKLKKNSSDDEEAVVESEMSAPKALMERSPEGVVHERLVSNKESDRSKDKSKSSRDRDRERGKERTKDRKDDKSSSRTSSSSSSSKHRSSSSSNSKSSSSSSRSSRDDKDRHRSSSSKSSSSSSSRDKYREKSSSSKTGSTVGQADKDKETLSLVLPQPISKLGKIPKKSRDTDSDKSDTAAASPTAKKISISIEVPKDFENRPKTVKTFNSKFRSHGLAEEAPPPPSRRGLKKPTSTPSAPGTTIPLAPSANPKRHSESPTYEFEKKSKLDVALASNHVDKPGSIKLISPKAKRLVLLTIVLCVNWLNSAAALLPPWTAQWFHVCGRRCAAADRRHWLVGVFYV